MNRRISLVLFFFSHIRLWASEEPLCLIFSGLFCEIRGTLVILAGITFAFQFLWDRERWLRSLTCAKWCSLCVKTVLIRQSCLECRQSDTTQVTQLSFNLRKTTKHFSGISVSQILHGAHLYQKIIYCLLKFKSNWVSYLYAKSGKPVGVGFLALVLSTLHLL